MGLRACHFLRFLNLEMGNHPFSLGYEVILSSSFNIVFSNVLVYSISSHVPAKSSNSQVGKKTRGLISKATSSLLCTYQTKPF